MRRRWAAGTCRLRRRRAWAGSNALGGLAQGTLLTTYCYWGYYNITFLGSEVKQPEKTIPRAILLSVMFVAAFYVLMNLAALPSLNAGRGAAARRKRQRARCACNWWPILRVGVWRWAGYTIAALVVWTAFCERVLAAAGLLARALCGGAGWQLLPLSGRGASAPWDSASVAGGAGSGGGRRSVFSRSRR
jgi:amino acid transporter